MLSLIFFCLIFSQFNVFAEDLSIDSIKSIGYTIENSKFLDSISIKKLITLCRNKPQGFKCDMPLYNNAAGALKIYEYSVPFDKFTETITTETKQNIFTSTICSYKRIISQEKMKEFIKNGKDILRFVSYYEISGKFGTRFTYTMDGELMPNKNFIIEKEIMRPGAKRTAGIAGYINTTRYFTILTPIDANHTRRIIASWNDAGGNIPIVGNIKADPNEIADGMDRGNMDIITYYKNKGYIK